MVAFTGNGTRHSSATKVLVDLRPAVGASPNKADERPVQVARAPPRRDPFAVAKGPERMLDLVAEDSAADLESAVPTEFAEARPERGYSVNPERQWPVRARGLPELRVDASFTLREREATHHAVHADPERGLRRTRLGGAVPSGDASFCDEHISGRVLVEAYDGSGQLDVLRMAYRETPKKESTEQ